ncbi:MAG: DEAD/DEAH box helicase [Chlamydiales bacterium]|nr:DEAD/DEAH box helicase [Chlamydiales bacterium]
MLNFRKLKQDFSPNVVKEGKDLYDKGSIVIAKISQLDSDRIRLNSKVKGHFDNVYESEIEIDRFESKTVDSNCDCAYSYDCQHIAALLFHLEDHLDEILVDFSKVTDLDTDEHIDEEEKEELRQTFTEAKNKEVHRKDEKYQNEVLEEYAFAAQVLAESPFFLPEERITEDRAELAVIFNYTPDAEGSRVVPEVQLALRLPFRSKPLNVVNIKDFLEAIRYHEPLHISGKRYFFTSQSFDGISSEILNLLLDHARYPENGNERYVRTAQLELEAFGTLLAKSYDLAVEKAQSAKNLSDQHMPCLYQGSLESPLSFSTALARLRFDLEYLEAPNPKILLKPLVIVEKQTPSPEEGVLFECAKPGFIHNTTYYRFLPNIKRSHLRHLGLIRNMTVPEPLFGTFIENALPEIQKYAEILNKKVVERFVTLPFALDLKARVELQYIDGELEASLYFQYDKIEIPAASSLWTYEHAVAFVTEQGILARNLDEEKKIIDDLFLDFAFDAKQGIYVAKTEKKIVEFMTDIAPRNKSRVSFEFPDNLLDQFIYDQTHFELHFRESSKRYVYEVDVKINGHLRGVKLELLWECISLKKSFIEIEVSKGRGKQALEKNGKRKILVLNLETLVPLIQLFDEIGISKLDDHKEERPLWSLAGISLSEFENLPIKVSMSSALKEIQDQMLGIKTFITSPVPKEIKADLRKYQLEGVQWLEKLRKMYLSGILADDMGLGKTLQAIVAITQNKSENPKALSLIVCPTSLLYNWKEEFTKFNPKLKILLIDGVPSSRKKLLSQMQENDVVITTYTLLQKDIDTYKTVEFSYAILDEAQHIKNRGTRNAKSVKAIQAVHRLVLTGTPVENSLEELWSLFDFLMPGLLSSFDRFVEKYVRNIAGVQDHLEGLKRKLTPFILRRMKSDVLQDLPPVSEIIYYCHLTDVQKELYNSYAASAREELSRLVGKEGFEKVHIHVLATLTRLKQICCHPAIFAKENVEEADSAKYEMMLELLQSLIEGNHKTVVFSQYTKMLGIMKEELLRRGIAFSYLDGSSKNRLEIVKQFNDDESIPVFLVSLKAGGSGLNIVGADTVIHYDMWWNPAVENQATDRVYRLGQKRSVSSYKLITLGTIEEKIMNMQNRKKGLVKKIVSCDDEAMAKLTWEEVLELLQT